MANGEIGNSWVKKETKVSHSSLACEPQTYFRSLLLSQKRYRGGLDQLQSRLEMLFRAFYPARYLISKWYDHILYGSLILVILVLWPDGETDRTLQLALRVLAYVYLLSG